VSRTDTIFGTTISPLRCDELAALMTEVSAPVGQGAALLVTMNLDHVVQLRTNAAFRAAYDRAWVVTIDGAPVFKYAKLRGLTTPERCPGSDLLVKLVDRLRPGVHRPYFIVSRDETGERLVALLVARGFEAGAVGFASPAFGFEKDPVQSEALCKQIREHGTTHLIVGVGAPKSEIWVDQYRGELGDLYACGFGSGADFLVDVAKRAPKLFRRMGIEWLWRVGSDPRRLWRRYFVDSWAFIPAILEDLRASRLPSDR